MRRAVSKALLDGTITSEEEYRSWFEQEVPGVYERAFDEFTRLEESLTASGSFDGKRIGRFNREASEGFGDIR